MVSFVDIGGIIVHHCFNLIIRFDRLIHINERVIVV
jgi:hypothetical protein